MFPQYIHFLTLSCAISLPLSFTRAPGKINYGSLGCPAQRWVDALAVFITYFYQGAWVWIHSRDDLSLYTTQLEPCKGALESRSPNFQPCDVSKSQLKMTKCQNSHFKREEFHDMVREIPRI